MHPDFERSVPKGKGCLIPFPGGMEEVFFARHAREQPRASSRSGTAGEDLFNALAAALDQDDQHNYRKDGGNCANKCYIVHFPFSLLNELDICQNSPLR
jgi:hypothetical protein